jgi:hypothetical protein
MTDFYIIQDGAAYPHSYCADMPAAEWRLAELQAEKPVAWSIIPCDEWMASREASYLDKPATEITAEKFDDMLGCLPPIYCGNGDCDFRFSMSEFQFGRVTEQFAKIGNRYFAKYVRHRDESTYITAAIAA